MGLYSFRLPDVGEGTAEAEIVKWNVKVGDHVVADQPLADVLTNKATVELTSPVSGIVRALAGDPGQMAAVGAVLVTFEMADESAVDAAPATPAVPLPAAPSPVRAPVDIQAQTRAAASPAVRRRATELGIDVANVVGSGPGGRVMDEDLRALSQGGPPADITEFSLAGIRRQVAERMEIAKRRIPHFSYADEVDMTCLSDLRERLNEDRRDDRLSFLPYIIRAMVLTLKEFPELNGTFDDERRVLKRSASVHVGIAAHTERGLMVPVLRHAERKDIYALAADLARLTAAARNGTLPVAELQGSTITVTSLGSVAGTVATPIINYPELAILCPNRIVERPVCHKGQIVARKIMTLSAAFDHRVVDGYGAAVFIQRVRSILEEATEGTLASAARPT